jgi:preprotein translocase subunit SecE
VSNDHDEVSGDGQEPAGGAASGEDAKSSAGTAKPVVTTPLEASNGRSKARKAPSADDASSAETDSSDTGSSGAIPANAGSADASSEGSEASTEDSAEADAAELAVADAATTTGPVSSGAARAAARRSAARAGVSETKGAATPRRADKTTTKRPNMFARFGRFLREVVAELRKVIWPSRNQMVTYTIVVIVFVAFMVALVAGLDLLFAKGVLAVFG